MIMSKLPRFLLMLVALPALMAAQGAMVSGPMLGHQAKREATIWLETEGAKHVTLTYWPSDQPEEKKAFTKRRLRPTPIAKQPMKFILPLLEPGQSYDYSIIIDEVPQEFDYPLSFRTQTLWEWREPTPEFSFLFGTCAYINDAAYDRPSTPYGKGTQIYQHMADTAADFMIWGGDNLYLREVDFDSEGGIWYRYSYDRAVPDMQRLFATMPHYATWDDHDFGPNNSNRSYSLKATTLKAFTTYWANPSWGEPDNPGTYGQFTHGDAAFFLMDNRYHRDSDKLSSEELGRMKTQYGQQQREWLKQALLACKDLKMFTFKFIVTGGQMITDFGGQSESFGLYPEEREDLLNFIVKHDITGVVFLTGDVHFTELARKKVTETQWIYELTSSPLSSGSWDVGKSQRAGDPQRVKDTLVADQNFTKLTISGPKDTRVLTITCIDKTGEVRWTRDIPATDLR